MEELASPFGQLYEEIKEVCFGFARMNWTEVKKSEGLGLVRKRLRENELPGSVGEVIVELCLLEGRTG